MRYFMSVLACLVFLACIAVPQSSSALRIGEPVSEDALTVYPLVGEDLETDGDLESLFAVAREGLVTFHELRRFDPMRVYVENRSKKHVLMIGGTLLEGGKQDRIISCDWILAPGEGRQIMVLCVEEGRSTGGDVLKVADVIVPAGLRAQGALSQRIKEPNAFFGAQQRLWSQVGTINAATDRSRQASLRPAFETKEVRSLSERIADLLKQSKDWRSTRGILVFAHGEPVSIDLFASNTMLTKSFQPVITGVCGELSAIGRLRSSRVDVSIAEAFLDGLNRTQGRQAYEGPHFLAEWLSSEGSEGTMISARSRTLEFAHSFHWPMLIRN